MLYERDYRNISEEERLGWIQAEEKLNKAKKGGILSSEAVVNYHNELPEAIQHYKTLFPNNYLPTRVLRDKIKLKNAKSEFQSFLERATTEREILNYIKANQAYYFIGSILNHNYQFGHHKAFCFREFKLPPNFQVDFLIAGKSSGGYEFVFVELEAVKGQITTTSGEFGAAIRRGLKQISDWNSWLEANYLSLKLVYDKYLGRELELPREFFELDKSRLHYVVIAGRRKNFKRKTYHLKRKLLKESNILLLHYDNLIDQFESLIQCGNY